MEESFLKERLDRFLKIIPAEYKLADPIKKSPKGFTTIIEREGKAIKTGKLKEDPAETEKANARQADKTEQKSKKKSLDELLETGMI